MIDHHSKQVWSQPTQYIVTILLFGAAVGFLFYARELVASVVIAAILTYILNPIAQLLQKRLGLSHRLSATFAYAFFILIIVTILATSTSVIIDRVTALTEDLDSLIVDVEEGLQENLEIFGIELPLAEWVSNIDVNTTASLIPTDFLGTVSNLSANLIWVLVVFVTTFYLLQDWQRLRDWAIMQLPGERRDDFVRLYIEIKNVWQAYLRGQLVLMVVVGVFSGLGAAALGLRGAWFIGLMAGLFDVIPSVGPAIAAVIGISVGWVTGSTYLPVSNTVFAVLVAVLFSIVQGIENVWWRPRILGNSLRMHHALVFIGVMSSLALAGVFVTLVIVPVMGTIGVLWHYLRARMLGIDPWAEQKAVEGELMLALAKITETEVRANARLQHHAAAAEAQTDQAEHHL